MKRKAFKAALPFTLPIFLGYIFLGTAFGIFAKENGLNLWVALAMSIFIYAGSCQFVSVSLLCQAFNPLQSGLIAFMVNARHLFYGFSLLDRYKKYGKLKPYLIFSLSDETYSLIYQAKAPADVNEKWFTFFICALDQFYWVVGTIIGVVADSMIKFDSTGIDFAMTALFIVIFVEQWENTKHHLPALAGIIITIISRLIFGSNSFLIPAMIGIFVTLVLYNPFYTKGNKDSIKPEATEDTPIRKEAKK